ncbi:MAG: UDP-N-acetylmuramoyl-L-alanyl-D-glutamate--2,6-diaminopimelate ligase [Actinomycetota bacterium]|nr:UDP-N-acetylmuramoyl-L-alanyl-D-glutamate--2,6-diaminopimelate ligase [Actinomycetota bacterium]
MRIDELVRGIDSLHLEVAGGGEIDGITYDSRRIEPGDLFVAIAGFNNDGHLYLQEALRSGATGLVVEEGRDMTASIPSGVSVVRAADTRVALALLSDRFWGHPSGELVLVGITGTNGKTTTSHLVDAAARRAGLTSGLIGTVTYRVGRRELPVERTTPESSDLQRLLAGMVEAGCQVVSMEVSSHALALRRVEGCEFKVSVFTNLSQDHLDFHAGMEGYFAAKARLFVPPEKGGLGSGASAVNVDDSYGLQLLKMITGKVLTFGTSPEAELRGWLLEAGLKSSRVGVSRGGWSAEGDTALTGIFNLHNILAALASCLLLDMDADDSFRAILSSPGVPGRFQAVEEGQDYAVLVDYAHTPDSLRRVLEAARGIARGRLIVVFGCGGDRDRGKRPMMGEIAVRQADLAYITSDNPRSEEPEAIIDEIEEGARSAGGEGDYRRINERRTAIEAALEEARAGDVVIIAGKGHERGQIFADRIVPFDDTEEAKKALRRRLGRG